MPLSELTRSIIFSTTLFLTTAVAAYISLMFSFAYWQTVSVATQHVDQAITHQALVLSNLADEQRLRAIEGLLRFDRHSETFAGLFAANGRLILGNVESVPAGLEQGGAAEFALVSPLTSVAQGPVTLRVIKRRMPNGEILVIGRDMAELRQIAQADRRTLILGMLPLVGIAIGVGILLSLRARHRLAEVNTRVQRIVEGDLRQRLPIGSRNDGFDELAKIVNGMLNRIESLITEITEFGSNLAHGLRTPLTGLRLSLQRARDNAQTLEHLRGAVDRAIEKLDNSLAIVTALLRLAEIEHERRLSSFAQVQLGDIVREVSELYGPIAEDKKIAFHVKVQDDLFVHGDRELLFQAMANLVDNALKYTPAGGRAELTLASGAGGKVLSIRDTGPGIGKHEGDLVTRRFYRSEKSRRHAEGLGLGLSIVEAIVKLHGFNLMIIPGPGCVIEIHFPSSG